MEIEDDAPLAQAFKAFKRNKRRASNKQQHEVPPPPSHPQLLPADEHSPEIIVSEFDYSVENHFRAVDTISRLCGCAETLELNEAETKRLSNSINFLRHWRDFNYKPRIVRFARQHDSGEKDVIGEVTLPQFSAAAVREKEIGNVSEVGVEPIKDFVMNVGGAVWALDWCPRVDRNPENCIKYEFVAVAAHPPDSSYHKIGTALTGRGVIQIWCFLTIYVKDVPSQGKKKPRTFFKKNKTAKAKDPTVAKRPRGRPRKKPLSDTEEDIDSDDQHIQPLAIDDQRIQPLAIDDQHIQPIAIDDQHIQPLAIEYPTGSPGLDSSERTSGNASKPEDCVRVAKRRGRPCKPPNVLLLTGPKGRGNKRKARQVNQIHNNSLHVFRHCQRPDEDMTSITSSANSIPVDVALPRMILCLAHNGKVAWDVKWRPVSASFSESRTTMGYLAVLLGSGALEVWEVPLPHAVKLVYPPFQEHTDPRFIKLQPVFRSSMLKCGDRQSIPLAVEWSVSSPHNMIAAGCHDGVVAIWKFSVSDPLTESRPLVYINADAGPIRTLAWAPIQSNNEGANIIVTAGSKGFKFWDIRDPFRPLWVHPFLGTTFGLDWLPNPRCIYGAMEDGTMWLLSLERAPPDIPIVQQYHNVASKHGYHSFHCSLFAIWSLQASRLTGTVAYCGEEGSTICFQPSKKSLKDPSRHRLPHYQCGSILEEGSTVVVASPVPGSSFQITSPSMKLTQIKEDERRFKERSICRLTAGEETPLSSPPLPPKTTAMHRVRWNVNKGGERWLCSGGAAGLVRCQHIGSSIFY